MTKTQAISKARLEVRLYSQGRGWIVTQYDHKADAWRASQEMPFVMAQSFRRYEWNVQAYKLMGRSKDDAEFLACEKPL